MKMLGCVNPNSGSLCSFTQLCLGSTVQSKFSFNSWSYGALNLIICSPSFSPTHPFSFGPFCLFGHQTARADVPSFKGCVTVSTSRGLGVGKERPNG